MQFLENFIPQLVVDSPGRINIIGEHTDYNLGYILPTAIDKTIKFSFQKNGSENTCQIYSQGYDTGFEANLDCIEKSEVQWENYILGVLHEIALRSDKLRGFDCTIESKLPIGSGVSSSAALECGLAYGLNELFDLGLSKMDIVELSRAAEHNYVGTKCGIMDQYASVMSKEGHVILLDCESLAATYIPMEIAPYRVLLLNTNVSHSLATGEYNTRRSECETGVAMIQAQNSEVKALRHVDLQTLATYKDTMDPIVYKRCSYVIEENQRVLDAVKALKDNNLKTLGALMYETHQGLSELYEVSCPELDFLVDFSKGREGVLGARMMGGGFGGCTINLVHEDAMEAFIEAASKAYTEKFNIALTAFEAQPREGTSIVK